MMKAFKFVVPLMMLAGCVGYSWRSQVPEEMRTISVPNFRNESMVTELGAVVTRQTLREFQREGTFAIRSHNDASVEVQGLVRKVTTNVVAPTIADGQRLRAYRMTVTVEASVIDRKYSRVLVDGKTYETTIDIVSGDDLLTAERDASARAADEIARQIVDDVVGYRW